MPFSICRPILARARDATTIITADSLDVISSAIEDVVLQGMPDACVVVGVQRLSRALARQERYRALAAACQRLALCGVPDAAPLISGATVVPLRPEWPAAGEWFMAVSAPGFAVALLAVERAGATQYTGGYEALFSAEPRLVEGVCRSAAATLGLGWAPSTDRDEAAHQRHMALVRRRLLHHQQHTARPRPGADRLIAHLP